MLSQIGNTFHPRGMRKSKPDTINYVLCSRFSRPIVEFLPQCREVGKLPRAAIRSSILNCTNNLHSQQPAKVNEKEVSLEVETDEKVLRGTHSDRLSFECVA